jgi:hypothetical protein
MINSPAVSLPVVPAQLYPTFGFCQRGSVALKAFGLNSVAPGYCVCVFHLCVCEGETHRMYLHNSLFPKKRMTSASLMSERNKAT